MPLIGVVQRLGSSQLQGAEHTAVHVALHLQNPLDKLRVGRDPTHTPAGHILTLAHTVEFYAALLGAWYLQQADGMLVQNQTVGIVVHHYDVVSAGKVNQFLEKLKRGVSTCGHIGIVGPHQTDFTI